MDIIRVENLKKCFGNNNAVNDVSFSVKEGEIFGLLGPNGAGKSTTIKILVTILKGDSGRAEINGFDVDTQQNMVREEIGIIFQDPSLDDRLTAWENLYFHSKLYHVPPHEIKDRIDEALDLVGLSEKRKELIITFSGGMKRRLEIARGIIHTPKVLFLDEPTIGLDPQTRKHIWQYLADLRKKQSLTTFLTTHYMEEAEICDRIAIMDNGKIIALDTPQNLKKQVQNDIVTLVSDDNEALKEIIFKNFNITSEMEGDSLRISVFEGRTFLPRLFELAGGRIISVDIKKPTLEDVFIKLTGRRIRDEEASMVDKMRNSPKRRIKH